MNSLIGIDSCSAISFIFFFIFQIICILLCKFLIKLRSGTKSTITISNELLIKAYFSGILSGMLGIGGGLIINPLLLEMGYVPLVASALSAFVVLFTSASTSTQFLILGAFDMKNAVFVAFLSMTGSLIGCLFLRAIMTKYKRYCQFFKVFYIFRR